MADLGVWVVRRGAPEMEMAQAQKEAAMEMAHQHPPSLFLDFAPGGKQSDRTIAAAAGGSGSVSRRRLPCRRSSFSLQPQAQQFPKMMGGGLDQLRKRPATGLRLDFDEGSVPSTSAASVSCLLGDEVAAQRDQCRNEMDLLIQEHAERLRRALADIRRRQYRSLVGAAEAAASRRLREKEAEASEAARRGAEMEDRVARLRAEASAWQAKALADQSTAAALHAQLQQAQAHAAQCKPDAEDAGAADDAGSCFVDPARVVAVAPPPPIARPCRTCGRRAAAVVLLPCRHLCVCAACEPAVSANVPGAFAACPMCRGGVTGTVQVFFS
ncbi:hypothetical protein PR202_gb07490 [Eleusine coracana subsp. coracana]|uniref:RING-type domain-containing protein n=1 Tax=Eleusine coracana subsp. coracana TaxID=191504 RepID=A0AAV5EBY4_ELECO|nr:hypothetical protein PR202_gb07490 [Eleusine coracana subsp. coracana]